MDPIAVLQRRIEQLEAKLGLPSGAPIDGPQYQGDSATANLVSAAEAMQHATAGHEKVQQAMNMATELNNYTDPNYAQNIQQNMMHTQEVVAAEPVLKNHCHCMHICKQAAPVMESEPIQQVPQMQEKVQEMQAAAQEVHMQAEEVAQGVQQLAETCGTAASDASEQLAAVAQKVETAEEKFLPKRRNGLD